MDVNRVERQSSSSSSDDSVKDRLDGPTTSGEEKHLSTKCNYKKFKMTDEDGIVLYVLNRVCECGRYAKTKKMEKAGVAKEMNVTRFHSCDVCKWVKGGEITEGGVTMYILREKCVCKEPQRVANVRSMNREYSLLVIL